MTRLTHFYKATACAVTDRLACHFTVVAYWLLNPTNGVQDGALVLPVLKCSLPCVCM